MPAEIAVCLGPKSSAEIADDLATRVNHLFVSRVDPDRFHVERNSIAVELRRLAKRLRGEPARPEHSFNPRKPLAAALAARRPR